MAHVTLGRMSAGELLAEALRISETNTGSHSLDISRGTNNDRTLRRYLQHIDQNYAEHVEQPSSREKLIRCGFPADYDLLYLRLRTYLSTYAMTAKPSSLKKDRISSDTLKKERDIMLSWVRHIYPLLERAPINMDRLRIQTMECIDQISTSLSLSSRPIEKPITGPEDLDVLIQNDADHTNNIPYSQCHHLAWCISVVTGLRPSSLAKCVSGLSEGESFLTWGDITFTRIRLEQPGHFLAQIRIRNVKGNVRTGIRTINNKELVFDLCSPKRFANLNLSVPHRLLAIALRRRILDHINDVDDLLNGQQVVVRVKQEYLGTPVFVSRATSHSVASDMSPMSVNRLSKYIKAASRTAGFAQQLTMYNFRRYVASELASKYGNDRARQILGHSAGTLTLEKHYLKLAHNIPLVSATVGEDEDEELTVLRTHQRSAIARRVSKEEVLNKQGPMLSRLLDEALATDLNFLRLRNMQEADLYRRRLRYRLGEELWRMSVSDAESSETVQDRISRELAAEQQAAGFERSLREILTTGTLVGADDASTQQSGTQPNHMSTQNAFQQEQSIRQTSVSRPINDRSLRLSSPEASENGIRYIHMARAFMTQLLTAVPRRETGVVHGDTDQDSDEESQDRSSCSTDSDLEDEINEREGNHNDDLSNKPSTTIMSVGRHNDHEPARGIRSAAVLLDQPLPRSSHVTQLSCDTLPHVPASNHDARALGATADVEDSAHMVLCPLCEADETVSAQDKGKLRTPGNQKQHVAGPFHTQPMRFVRELEMLAVKSNGFYRCPFCVRIHGNDDSLQQPEFWSTRSAVLTHTMKSSQRSIDGGGEWKLLPENIRLHDVYKKEAGLYNEQPTSELLAQSRRRGDEHYRLARSIGFEADTQIKELADPIKVPGYTSLVYGGGVKWVKHSVDKIKLMTSLTFEVPATTTYAVLTHKRPCHSDRLHTLHATLTEHCPAFLEEQVMKRSGNDGP